MEHRKHMASHPQPSPRTAAVAAMKGRPLRVLVTGTDRSDGDLFARLLVARGAEVHMAGPVIHDGVEHDSTPAALVRHKTPPVSSPSYVPTLARIAREHSMDAILPTAVEGLSALAAARAAFAPSTHVAVATPTALAMTEDRWVTAEHLARRGVPTPRSAVPSQYSSPTEARDALGEPLVARPRATPRARLLFHDEPTGWGQLSDETILQELIAGPAYKVIIYRPEGRSRTRRSAGVLESTSGISSFDSDNDSVDVAPDSGTEDVQRVALAAVRALGVTGPACVDVRRTASGNPTVLAVHARICPHIAHVPSALDSLLQEAWAQRTSAS